MHRYRSTDDFAVMSAAAASTDRRQERCSAESAIPDRLFTSGTLMRVLPMPSVASALAIDCRSGSSVEHLGTLEGDSERERRIGVRGRCAVLRCRARLPPPPCILKTDVPITQMEHALAGAAERSEAGPARAAGDRSMSPGAAQSVGERDRRRSVETSPNSRRSRSPRRRTSSHLQGRDSFNRDTISSFVGIDVAQNHLDVHILNGAAFRAANSREERPALLQQLPAPGTCLIVVEATGRYEQALVCDLTAAGHAVSVVNPRQVRD